MMKDNLMITEEYYCPNTGCKPKLKKEHVWIRMTGRMGWYACQKCGVIRSDKNQKACVGPVKIKQR